MFLRGKSSSKQNWNNADTKKNSSSLALRSCPNPNCIRCQRYILVQQRANRRLPQLIRQWKKRNQSSNDDRNNQRNINIETCFKRIIEGVSCGVPPLPIMTGIDTDADTDTGMNEGSSPWWRLSLSLPVVKTKHVTQWQNATNQYPTVCFIPRLPVHTNATLLHPEACTIISSSPLSSITAHDHHCDHPISKQEKIDAISSSSLSSVSSSSSPQTVVLMDEYLQSQFNGGQWQTNDSSMVNPEADQHSQSKLWEVLYLMNQGQWMHDNIQRCPNTFALVKNIPGLMQGSMFGNIFFSVLYPGTKIDEHCGPTNLRHRMHFPLLVPSTSHDNHNDDRHGHDSRHGHGPRLIVNGEIFTWEEGVPFIFDDSLAHAAEYPANDKSEVRVVLVVDLWHADLFNDEKTLLTDLYPSVRS